MPPSTQLHPRIVKARWEAVAHAHGIVHAVRLWLDGEIAHMWPRRYRRAHRSTRLHMELRLVRVMLLRMVLHLRIW